MEPDYTTAFDALHTNNFIQKLKVLHAFSDTDTQRFLAVYIKFLELQYTLSNHLKYRRFDGSINTVCDALCPFCSPAEQKQLKQIGQFMDSFETIRAVSETMELMKDIFPADGPESKADSAADESAAFTENAENATFSGDTNPMTQQLLMGILPEEQRILLEALLNSKSITPQQADGASSL